MKNDFQLFVVNFQLFVVNFHVVVLVTSDYPVIVLGTFDCCY